MEYTFIDLIDLISNSYLIAVSLLVQFVVYPTFIEIEKKRFKIYHTTYSKKVFYIIGPVMVFEICCSVIKNILILDLVNIITGIIVVCIWILTFAFIVPIHNKIKVDLSKKNLFHLTKLNLFRSILWVIKFCFLLIY